MSTANEVIIAALKREIVVGIEDLDHGRFQIYNDADFTSLADTICQHGKIRLNGLRLKVAAKVHGKKRIFARYERFV